MGVHLDHLVQFQFFHISQWPLRSHFDLALEIKIHVYLKKTMIRNRKIVILMFCDDDELYPVGWEYNLENISHNWSRDELIKNLIIRKSWWFVFPVFSRRILYYDTVGAIQYESRMTHLINWLIKKLKPRKAESDAFQTML